jgi:hypothetical protein
VDVGRRKQSDLDLTRLGIYPLTITSRKEFWSSLERRCQDPNAISTEAICVIHRGHGARADPSRKIRF